MSLQLLDGRLIYNIPIRKYIIDNIINYLSKLSVITVQKSTDGKTQMEAKTSHHVIHISRKLRHYSHSAVGEYIREVSRRTSSVKSVCCSRASTFEPHIDEEVDNDNKVYKWYERSMVRIVNGTKSPDTGIYDVR